jgi:hypothetical protein
MEADYVLSHLNVPPLFGGSAVDLQIVFRTFGKHTGKLAVKFTSNQLTSTFDNIRNRTKRQLKHRGARNI